MQGDSSSSTRRLDGTQRTGKRGTMNTLAEDLDRKLASVRARGMSGFSTTMQEIAARKARHGEHSMPDLLPSRSLLPKVSGTVKVNSDHSSRDGSSSGSGSGVGHAVAAKGTMRTGTNSRGLELARTYKRAATSIGRRRQPSPLASVARMHREPRNSKHSDYQDDLMRSLEERWRQLGLPTSSDLRFVVHYSHHR